MTNSPNDSAPLRRDVEIAIRRTLESFTAGVRVSTTEALTTGTFLYRAHARVDSQLRDRLPTFLHRPRPPGYFVASDFEVMSVILQAAKEAILAEIGAVLDIHISNAIKPLIPADYDPLESSAYLPTPTTPNVPSDNVPSDNETALAKDPTAWTHGDIMALSYGTQGYGATRHPAPPTSASPTSTPPRADCSHAVIGLHGLCTACGEYISATDRPS